MTARFGAERPPQGLPIEAKYQPGLRARPGGGGAHRWYVRSPAARVSVRLPGSACRRLGQPGQRQAQGVYDPPSAARRYAVQVDFLSVPQAALSRRQVLAAPGQQRKGTRRGRIDW